MFTGIIEETGTVEQLESGQAGARLTIQCKRVLEDAATGCSIAVNGVCLTALNPTRHAFSADLAPETLRRTNLGDVRPGSVVNLERPLSPAGRLSGHIVQGHVDGTGEMVALDEIGGGNFWLKVRVPVELDPYLVFKGSIAVDGISLTVASMESRILGVTIIPHTIAETNLRTRRPGDRVNLECDIIAKYVEKLAGRLERPSALSTN
jgi:riboflavin synthase